MKFIDVAKIYIKSGDGGKGHISFRKEKFVPKGGPDGGNGGKGGDVILETNPHMNTLLDFKYKVHFKANNGNPGEKARRTGKNGQDEIIKVPVGTVVRDAETEEVIADLAEAEERFVIAKGGRGGRGNSEFVTSTRQAPRYAEDGRPGEEKWIILELKVLADVGLVGFPNAGKSTLISVISAAKPKIADYPFTTLIPNLGIVKLDINQNYVVADIPGLIEGASEGKGLGYQFLRHVERTRLLVFLIDSMSEDPVNDYEVLQNELYSFNPDMQYKKRIVCITKIDSISDDKKRELQKLDFGENVPKLLISSVSGENIEKIKWAMWEHLEKARAED